MQLLGCQIELLHPTEREHVVHRLTAEQDSPLLVLDTCQRLESFGLGSPELPHLRVTQQWEDGEAFERLARIAAGLESRILGELEVLGQVRRAYRQFQTVAPGARRLDRIFQDAIALGRKARRASGIDRNLTSLGALAAREMIECVPPGAPLAVVGSGSLAGSVARYLGKRGNSPVRVTSRCPDNAVSLALEIGGFGAGLDDMSHLFQDVAGIITATAAPHPVVYPHHLLQATRPLRIYDLGVPPDCSAEVRQLPGVTYIGLNIIEARAQVNSEERIERAAVAARIIRDGATAWAHTC